MMTYTQTLAAATADYITELAKKPKTYSAYVPDAVEAFTVKHDEEVFTVSINNTSGFLIVADEMGCDVIRAAFTYCKGLPFVYGAEDISDWRNEPEFVCGMYESEIELWDVILDRAMKVWFDDLYLNSKGMME